MEIYSIRDPIKAQLIFGYKDFLFPLSNDNLVSFCLWCGFKPILLDRFPSFTNVLFSNRWKRAVQSSLRTTLRSDRPVKGLMYFKHSRSFSPRREEKKKGSQGGQNRQKRLPVRTRASWGWRSQRRLSLSIMQYTYVPPSWPYAFFSSLRHGGSSPCVLALFCWGEADVCERAEPRVTSACSTLAPVKGLQSACCSLGLIW